MRGPLPGWKRPRRAPDVCHACGERYCDFRTNLTFGEVRRMMWSPGEPAEWRYRTRRMVLGFWNELKRQWWHAKHEACQHQGKEQAA